MTTKKRRGHRPPVIPLLQSVGMTQQLHLFKTKPVEKAAAAPTTSFGSETETWELDQATRELGIARVREAQAILMATAESARFRSFLRTVPIRDARAA